MDQDTLNVLIRIANLDWVIGYELTQENMIELDRIQILAREILKDLQEKNDDQ